jgi:DNA-binding response OmpR family regulator
MARAMLGIGDVSPYSSSILICDEDRWHNELLVAGFSELGFRAETTRSYAEAFALACARDFSALVTAPFLRDSSALILPAALGIRRPPVVVLASRMTERLDPEIVRRVGFDAQLSKVVDPRIVERLVRSAFMRAALAVTQAPQSRDDMRGAPR